MDYSLETMLYGMQFRRLLEKELEPIEREYGLCRIDMQILFYLDCAGERNTSKDILQLGMFTRSHISQSLSRLQKKGYVRMEQDSKDRRCTHNHLTEAAGGILQKLREIYTRIRGVILKGVTEEELEVLDAIVRKVNGNINSGLPV